MKTIKPMERTSIKDVAKILNKNKQFIRVALQQEKYPFGIAVKMTKRWAYFINTAEFRKYIAAEEFCEVSKKSGGKTWLTPVGELY